MTVLTPADLEGKLNAHRELMIDFIAALLGGEESIKDFTRRLADDSNFKDHEEDPGIVPGEGLAIETSAATEIRSILEAARARAAATARQAKAQPPA
ncbi:hypothetical protein [Rhizobium sp. SSA_523]|uniref:hypothetical protein n=1 Tax=Rhizobium sp. SSA_523 TaxID=2952477 RepID=UPI0020906CF2|nr:hypothetical protein [Rhizobium sp. SSA_523]MCO5731730.1 hypothetical protein [Rhizobium sp. SSA_523]WKC22897.1 hypothetical protein QTJ18_18885 [Rhizobium sp. SSA_523]